MKLVIQEYLSMLKESGEFDQLLPDVLTARGMTVISRAQAGAVQDGVDVAAVGKNKKGKESLYLFVIKRGDIGRTDWEGGPNAVIPTLNDVKNAYLHSRVSSEHQHMPKIIVLCTTGDLKQTRSVAWTGYVKNNRKSGKIDYEFWNGATVAGLIEDYLLDEYAMPAESRALLRKTLALVGEPEYNLGHFHELLRAQLVLKEELDPTAAPTTKKLLIKGLNSANLALQIVFRWAENEGSLRNAYLAAERTVLWGWEAIRRSGLAANQDAIAAYTRILGTFGAIATAYFAKLRPYCLVRDALSVYSGESAIVTEQVFEQIGILACIGIMLLPNTPSEHPEGRVDPGRAVCQVMIELIKNNPVSSSPSYDEHMIEICMALLLMIYTQHDEAARTWIDELVQGIYKAARVGRGLPICSDSFEDQVDIAINGIGERRDKLQECSTLLPALAQWAALLQATESYDSLVRGQQAGKMMEKVCFQLWYPDQDTGNFLYHEAAHRESGTTEAPIALPGSMDELRSRVRQLKATGYTLPIEALGWGAGDPRGIDLMAARHFRTPVNPDHWQRYLVKQNVETDV